MTPFLPDEIVAAIISLIAGVFGVTKLQRARKAKDVGDGRLSGRGEGGKG